MQARVLDAALRCMGELGYHTVSLQDIADRAGVSRGAITHHYTSKFELMAEAIRHFSEWRKVQFESALTGPRPSGLRGSLEALWAEFADVFSISFEIIIALRDDSALMQRLQRTSRLEYGDEAALLDSLFPELSGSGLSGPLAGVISAFYCGAMVEGIAHRPEKIDAMRRIFISMVEAYISAKGQVSDDAATASPASANGNEPQSFDTIFARRLA